MGQGRHSMDTQEEKKKGELGLHVITHGFNRDIEETVTKVIDGSLRAGKKVEFEGTVVVIGDVNAGAEVIAEDNIIVFGTLRGLAHAGARGNRNAIIVANEIDVTQIRIADIVKEIENPVFEEEEEQDEESAKDKKKKKKDKREEKELEEEMYEEIKTRAYIKEQEIILE